MTFGKSQQLKKIINKNIPRDKELFLDWWLALNISLISNIDFIDESLIKYRRHHNIATMPNRSILQKLRTRIIIITYLLLNKLGI